MDNEQFPKDASLLSTKRGFVGRHRFHRYPTRTLLLVLVPPTIAAYFLVVWQFLVTQEIDPVKFGHRNANWVYYSWFIIGVFGLNASRYGLAGIEAAMLQDPFWRVDNAMVLMMHSEKGWSGPGGWIRCLNNLVRARKSITQRLWYLLAFISLMISIALPLSGLSLELYDGYVKSSAHPSVVGHNWETFNRRQNDRISDRAALAWRAAAPVTIPGLGVAYTPSNLRRNKFTSFDELPNSLPLDEGIPELFIAPQSNVPVNGNTWGLKLRYNCSIIESASELTILNQRSSLIPRGYTGIDNNAFQFITPNNDSIYMFNNSNSVTARMRSTNLWAYGELGFNDFPIPDTPEWEDSGEHHVLEYVLWQARYYETYVKGQLDFDPDVSPFISDIGQPILRTEKGVNPVNDTWFNMEENESHLDIPQLLAMSKGINITHLANPIGVRCLYSSDPGTANVKAQTSTFDSFEKVYPNKSTSAEASVPQFGKTAANMLFGQFYEIFTSTNSDPPMTESNSVMYLNYVKPQLLRESIMRAFAMDALQLMYDGINSFQGPYTNNNMTSATLGKILGPGAVPPLIPAILFGIWAVACVLLGCIYGFRQRWSEQLDGFSLFSFGVHMVHEIPDRSRLTTGERFEDCDELRNIPGMLGSDHISDGIRRRYDSLSTLGEGR